jgi:hypothetical protein
MGSSVSSGQTGTDRFSRPSRRCWLEGRLTISPWFITLLGLFFVLSKPQIGAGVAVFWGYQAWRESGYQGVLRLLAPITMATLISFAIYGFWPIQRLEVVPVYWNFSFWPYSFPVGAILLTYALYKKNLILASGSSPFFAPYMNFHSYAILLPAVARSNKLSVLFFLIGWIYIIATGDIVNIIWSRLPQS